jgi:hypothetical protein
VSGSKTRLCPGWNQNIPMRRAAHKSLREHSSIFGSHFCFKRSYRREDKEYGHAGFWLQGEHLDGLFCKSIRRSGLTFNHVPCYHIQRLPFLGAAEVLSWKYMIRSRIHKTNASNLKGISQHRPLLVNYFIEALVHRAWIFVARTTYSSFF